MDKRLLDWFKKHKLIWADSLPHSMVGGWTNGKFSVIYNGEQTESYESVLRRYKYLFNT